MLTNLSLLSGLPGANLLVAIAGEFVMLGTGVLGTLAPGSGIRWTWYTISCLGYLVLVHQVFMNGSKASGEKDGQTTRFYRSFAGVTLIIKVLYPM